MGIAANGETYKRYAVIKGKWGFTGTVDSCQKLCEKHDNDCLGIQFDPNYINCHLLVESDVWLPLRRVPIHSGDGTGPIAGSTKSIGWHPNLRNSWSCFKLNRPGKWSSPRPVQGQN